MIEISIYLQFLVSSKVMQINRGFLKMTAIKQSTLTFWPSRSGFFVRRDNFDILTL